MKYSTSLACLALCLIFPLIAQPQAKKAAGVNRTTNEWTLRGKLIADPHNRAAHDELCELLRKQGRHRELAKERTAWIDDNPTDFNEVIDLDSEANTFLNDDDVAIGATRKYLASLSNDDLMFGWANNYLGKELMRRRRFAEALPYLKQAVEKDPGVGDFWSAFGTALLAAGKTNAAIEALRHALDVNPSSATIHEFLAVALEASGNPLDAETELKVASNLDKSNLRRLTTLARLQIKHHKLEDASATINRVLEIDHKYLYAYLLMARVFDLEGQHDKATTERKRADSLLGDDMRRNKSPNMLIVPMAIFASDDPEELARLEEADEPRLNPGDRFMLFAAYVGLNRTS